MNKSDFIIEQLNEIFADNNAHCIRELVQIIKIKLREKDIITSESNIYSVITKYVSSDSDFKKSGKCYL